MGKIICVGLGPGDPDLMSVRARKMISAARTIAYFRKKGRPGRARKIVEGLLAPDILEYAMEYPVTTEMRFDAPEYNRLLADFYDDWARRLEILAQDDDVLVLCEGDPLFYGSFMHLHVRLSGRAQTNGVQLEIVPGITGMSGCWTAYGQPMAWGDDLLCVMMGTWDQEKLALHMASADAFVIMKIGANLEKVRAAAMQAGRLDDCVLIEQATMPGERIIALAQAVGVKSPYFAIVLAHGQGRRPQ